MVIRTAGINCDAETVHAWRLVGADVDLLHVNRLIEKPALLREYAVLTVPGGFSYGDDVAAGKIFANQLVHHVRDELDRFIADGRLVLGICNGFQVLVKAGLLPGPDDAGDRRPRVTVIDNAHGRFEDRWIHVRVETDRSPWLEQDELLHMPIAHAEGRVVFDSEDTLARLRTKRTDWGPELERIFRGR